jgi:hypothetical protein
MEEFGRLKRDFLKSLPGLPGRIPDEPTFRQVFQCLTRRNCRGAGRQFLKYIRGHWSIENQLHWIRDKSISGRQIPGKLALHRLRKMKMRKKRVSAKHHMIHTAPDSDFLYEALFSE